MTLDEAEKLPAGIKVRYREKFYDFGYVGQTGKVIVYEEGEINMQDALACDPELVELAAERGRLDGLGDDPLTERELGHLLSIAGSSRFDPIEGHLLIRLLREHAKLKDG